MDIAMKLLAVAALICAGVSAFTKERVPHYVAVILLSIFAVALAFR